MHAANPLFGNFGQRLEILASWGGAPPGQTYRTSRLRLGKAQQFHPLVVSFGIGSYFGHERDTITVCHHLHHGRERGGSKPGRGVPASGSTKREGLVAQAVSFLKQDQPMLITQPAGSHPFGNPQPGWQAVPPGQVAAWYHD